MNEQPGHRKLEAIGAQRFKTAQTYQRLKRLLIYQKVPPRTKLDSVVLARRLKISKTPVREAFIMLAEERIIKAEPGRGYFTKQLDAREIAEDYEVTFAMLKYVLETHKDMTAPGDWLPKPIVSEDPSEATRLYARFIENLFEAIASMAENKFSLHIIQSFNARTGFIRELDLERPQRFGEISKAMSDFIDQFERGDINGAIANLEQQYKKKSDLLDHLVEQAHLMALKASDEWPDLLHLDHF